MRKGYSLLLLLLCFSWVSAQNWAPINTTDKYNYKLDGSDVPTNTLWVDSAIEIGIDSVFYINRTFTQIADTIINYKHFKTLLKNQPQFLQRVVKRDSTGIYHFNSPGNFVYIPNASLNDSWLFDSTNSLSVTVTLVDTSTVLGVIDSIKVLRISNGGEIIVSKDYGFIKYPFDNTNQRYYRLVGVEGRNLGEKVAGFNDFFNFDIGDIFEYRQSSSAVWDAPPYIGNATQLEKLKIIGKQVRNDTMSYNYFSTFRDTTYYQYGIHVTGGSGYIDSFTLVDNVENELNIYPGSLRFGAFSCYLFDFTARRAFAQISYMCGPQATVPLYVTCKYSKDINGRYVKEFESYYRSNDTTGVNDTLKTAWSYDDHYRKFVTGLGLFKYNKMCFEHGADGDIIAYSTSTDSMGVLDSIPPVGIDEIGRDSLFITSPNPFDRHLDIRLQVQERVIITMLNLNGTELITQQSTDSHIEINTTALPAGMYIVEVRTNDGVARKKVVKL